MCSSFHMDKQNSSVIRMKELHKKRLPDRFRQSCIVFLGYLFSEVESFSISSKFAFSLFNSTYREVPHLYRWWDESVILFL